MTEKDEITDQELLDRLAGWIVERRMAAPAIIFLESHRPMSFVGSQFMIASSPIVQFLEPFIRSMFGEGYEHPLYERFAGLMEKRENLERLIITIERKSQEFQDRQKEEKKRRKALKREAKERRKALKQARREGRMNP